MRTDTGTLPTVPGEGALQVATADQFNPELLVATSCTARNRVHRCRYLVFMDPVYDWYTPAGARYLQGVRGFSETAQQLSASRLNAAARPPSSLRASACQVLAV